MKRIIFIGTHMLLIIPIVYLIFSISIELISQRDSLQSMIYEYRDIKGYELIVNNSSVEDVAYLPIIIHRYSVIIDDTKDTLFINTGR